MPTRTVGSDKERAVLGLKARREKRLEPGDR